MSAAVHDAAARSGRVHRAAAARRRAPLPRPPPLPRARCTRARSAASSCKPGCEPLLLPDAHPDQRRADPRQVRGPGVPARVDPPHPRSRRRSRQAKAGSSCGCGWPKASASTASEVASCARRAAGRALRLRRLRRAGARAQPGRGGRVVAHRVLRARPDDRAHRGLGAALPVGRAATCSSTSARACRARAATREEAIDFVVQHARTRELQERVRRGARSARPRFSGTCSTASHAAHVPGAERRRDDRAATRGRGSRARRACASTGTPGSTCSLYPEKGLALNADRRRDRRALHRRAHAWRRSSTQLAARFADAPRERVAGEVSGLPRAARAARSAAGRAVSAARDDGATQPSTGRTRWSPSSPIAVRCAASYCSNPVELARHGAELDDRGVATRARAGRSARRGAGAPYRRRAAAARRSRGARRARRSELGLYTNLITSGVPLTRERLASSRPAA